ncbi:MULTISPECIES: copper homeostasis periplasmic binding protein CopC [Paraburkholderia]|uniref:Copper homeostasis periplasmic binding protein CopC n=1 Tax=Paraburkholderia podalyriae TaxID=1938811 RepID=A0ABR7PRF8_9BURK|nr:copper homeostasis periplasmic binding protein CopC [Paraburkholderia podalyriae]MBC8748866.1 copper homeostasis periplasmic binding protein CopC [Paraburkholderia podalyriae]
MKLSDLSSSTLRALTSSAVALVMSSTAFAHAHLISSVPAANADTVAPADVTIHFTEPLEPAFSRITLADAGGKPATPTASTVDSADARVMRLALPQLMSGRYAVHWIAVATDGHRTKGDFAFNVK